MTTYTKNSLWTSVYLTIFGINLLLSAQKFAVLSHAAPDVKRGVGILEFVNGFPAALFAVGGAVAIIAAAIFVVQIPFNRNQSE